MSGFDPGQETLDMGILSIDGCDDPYEDPEKFRKMMRAAQAITLPAYRIMIEHEKEEARQKVMAGEK